MTLRYNLTAILRRTRHRERILLMILRLLNQGAAKRSDHLFLIDLYIVVADCGINWVQFIYFIQVVIIASRFFFLFELLQVILVFIAVKKVLTRHQAVVVHVAKRFALVLLHLGNEHWVLIWKGGLPFRIGTCGVFYVRFGFWFIHYNSFSKLNQLKN